MTETPCGPRGWLAIDPKGLCGERGFDFVNIFCNPDFALATAPGRLVRQAMVVPEVAGLERKRLLQSILSYAGLSAAWTIRDGDDSKLALSVAEAAAANSISKPVRRAARPGDKAPTCRYRPNGMVPGADIAADSCMCGSGKPAGSHNSGRSFGSHARRSPAERDFDAGGYSPPRRPSPRLP